MTIGRSVKIGRSVTSGRQPQEMEPGVEEREVKEGWCESILLSLRLCDSGLLGSSFLSAFNGVRKE